MENFIMMPIPASKYTAVCALLGGAIAISAGASAGAIPSGKSSEAPPCGAPQDTAQSSATEETLAPANQASDGTGATATSDASPSSGEVDAHGHPWSADLHASTKGKTKDGLWRMKVGVTRPDPLPGFPAADTGTAGDGAASEAGASAPTPAVEDEDEFAAFRNAAASSEATDAAAAAAAPVARNWTDADLGALCNQAAVKLGDPTPIKEIIASMVPAGEVAHSRNIPADKREEFAQAVEARAGIEFAG